MKKSLSELIHNPLNVRATKDFWRGQRGVVSGFVDFEYDFWGYRAAIKILLGYIGMGRLTPWKIISRWAPSSENDVESYVKFVCNPSRSSLRADEPLKSIDQFKELVYMMTWVERGKPGDFKKIDVGFAEAKKHLSKVQLDGYFILRDANIIENV